MTVATKHPDRFVDRHLGSREDEVQAMLRVVSAASLGSLMDEVIPKTIRADRALALPAALSEAEALEALSELARKNRPLRSFVGAGYSDTITPAVILRNVLENPGWYTAYTPYQAEIAQGRLEALLNFQTLIADLTGLPVANASLLDEATAAAEAMSMLFAARPKEEARVFLAARDCHPQTLAVVETRAGPLGIRVLTADPAAFDFASGDVFGCLVQVPSTDGAVLDVGPLCRRAHEAGAAVGVAADLLSLTLLVPPGELGADVAVGSSQRFGVPMGYGGPHAAYFATSQRFVRLLPGRLIGITEDQERRPALRMALQTREQHIRREKATSNICTSQVLLAVVAGLYAVYHGPEGLKAIARMVHGLTAALALGLERLGFKLRHSRFFDTLAVEVGEGNAARIVEQAQKQGMNLRALGPGAVGISLDEAATLADLDRILSVFAQGKNQPTAFELAGAATLRLPEELVRKSAFLGHPVFNRYHSETEMLRYLKQLASRDLTLADAMIPLGSCTMKLNAAVEMIPITWSAFARIHPFVPVEQAEGYHRLMKDLEAMLCEITGFAAISFQPNAGSQGEYAGLLVIRRFHASRGEGHRDVCLIPASAHGTNPASAVMAGLRVVVVRCDERGNIDLGDLQAKAAEHASRLAGLMVTYPSTHGVFEEGIRKICTIVHERGGQVYMDGANLNAQVGLCRPGDMGADVCHLNLHKTFCIPHGGGGPGAGPIGVAKHLAPFLPGHPVMPGGGEKAIGPVSAAPWGSASILPISWMYCRLMGAEGLRRATEVAILNANYLARRLEPYFPVLYKGESGRVAHECILDLRPLKKSSGVEVEDVAKRLMDFGFHAPTVSFPVPGTLMVEPTESESKAELDRFCEAMITIREEIREIEEGRAPRDQNVLKLAPHTVSVLTADEWTRPYSRKKAAYPVQSLRSRKFWPAVSRLNSALGDRNLVCTCPMTGFEGS